MPVDISQAAHVLSDRHAAWHAEEPTPDSVVKVPVPSDAVRQAPAPTRMNISEVGAGVGTTPAHSGQPPHISAQPNVGSHFVGQSAAKLGQLLAQGRVGAYVPPGGSGVVGVQVAAAVGIGVGAVGIGVVGTVVGAGV